MIKKQGSSYVLYTSDGKKRLGSHSSKAGAIKQEVAIKIAEKKRGK